MSNISSVEIIRPLWICWKILGAAKSKIQRYIIPYIIYSVTLQIIVTLCYPIHLAMALFRNDIQADNIKNFAVCITCIACSIKFIMFVTKLNMIYEVEAILRQLDARVRSDTERAYFQKIQQNVRNIAYLFLSFYMPVGVTAELSFIFRKERSLLYPAWFPFDWYGSTRNFYIANIYQIVGIFYQILQNYVDDCFPSMTLCLLSGHIKLLSIRLSRLGYCDRFDMLENEMELKRCIMDQKNLYRLFDTIQEIISLPMFIQFTVTAINVCVAMAALVFYVDALFDRLYYSVYFVSMLLQIFPTCYYGSYLQDSFAHLHYDIYNSNWLQQNRIYRKHMITFTERSLKSVTAFAAGMIRIHLDTFFATCRAAYSLFAVITRLRN